jgi:hypothetical protein
MLAYIPSNDNDNEDSEDEENNEDINDDEDIIDINNEYENHDQIGIDSSKNSDEKNDQEPNNNNVNVNDVNYFDKESTSDSKQVEEISSHSSTNSLLGGNFILVKFRKLISNNIYI